MEINSFELWISQPKKVRSLSQKKAQTLTNMDFYISSDPGKIRTCNRLIRSQVLYPVELRDQF